MKKAVFRGTITTKSPFFQSTPDNQKHTNKMAILYDGKQCLVPIISGNTIRSIIRSNIAADMLSRVEDGSLDYSTVAFLTSGGALDTQKKDTKGGVTPASLKAKFEAIRTFCENNIIASLLGGCIVTDMLKGKLICPPAILICRETQQDDTLPEYSLYINTKGTSHTRKDRVFEYDNFKKLHEKGVEEFCERIEGDKKKKKAKEADEQPQDDDKDNTTLRMIHGVEDYVVSNATFAHEMRIENPKKEEIGAIIEAFIRFQKYPRIGSFKKDGFGLVEMNYTLDIDNSRDLCTIHISDGKEYIPEGVAKEMHDAYKKYASSITVKKISIPIDKLLIPKSK